MLVSPFWRLKICLDSCVLSYTNSACSPTNVNTSRPHHICRHCVHHCQLLQLVVILISLLPVLAKVFESFIHDRLLDFLRPTLDPLQFGSLKGRSPLHALTSVLHSWQSALDKGHSVRALFVDYSKAFDRVNHNILLQKLLDRQVPHYLIKWLFSYLSDRQQRVRASGKTSTWRSLNGSMPQGLSLIHI